MNSCFNIQKTANRLSQSDINRPEMPETASRNAFLRLTDCGKARFVCPNRLSGNTKRAFPQSVSRKNALREAVSGISGRLISLCESRFAVF